MAKSRKSQKSKGSTEDSDIKANEESQVTDDLSAEAEVVVDEVVEATEETISDAADDVAAEPDAPVEEIVEEAAVAPEPVAEVVETIAESEPVPEHNDAAIIAPQHQDQASNSVFLPALLGGLIAAGLGFAVAYYFIPRVDADLTDAVAANSAGVSSLQDEISAVAGQDAVVDLTPVTDDIAALRETVTGEFEAFTTRLDDVETRLDTLEKQPSADGTLQDVALEAYQRELDELRAQVEEQAGAAIAQLEETRAEAAAIEQAALDAAQAAQIRTAIAEVETALASGEPMQAALTDLEDALGAPVPAPLAAVAEGAPTLAGLQAAFPEAARAALADARAGGASGEETSAFGAFLREQLNVRSVAPQEGDDANAVLSRAQAAVSEGKLQAALDEITALPDVAKAPLAEWIATAEARVAAVTAADDISLSLNVN